VVSQFFQLDRLVVEGGRQGKETGENNGIIRVKDQGFVTRLLTLCSWGANDVPGGIECMTKQQEEEYMRRRNLHYQVIGCVRHARWHRRHMRGRESLELLHQRAGLWKNGVVAKSWFFASSV